MVLSCWAYGCLNRHENPPGVKFYTLKEIGENITEMMLAQLQKTENERYDSNEACNGIYVRIPSSDVVRVRPFLNEITLAQLQKTENERNDSNDARNGIYVRMYSLQ